LANSAHATRPRAILTLSCQDQPGIVGAVGTYLSGQHCNIVDSAQFGEPHTQRFMMRVLFERLDGAEERAGLGAAFAPIAGRFAMSWAMHDAAHRTRVLIMVSKLDHCLNDLLYRYKVGALHIEPVAIVSNHRDTYQLAASYDVPFFHLAVNASNKPQQEAKLRAIVDDHAVELVVLARYMQILSDELCHDLSGRAINIHHSFLPSFKGAKPYHQAYARGVKLIGATAHYVTADLDEGPIIEQEVARVDYKMGPDDLVALGRDVECIALARAVQAHAEHRIFLNGSRTVVFR
jgi:formyltetrahydrofolate deformylase